MCYTIFGPLEGICLHCKKRDNFLLKKKGKSSIISTIWAKIRQVYACRYKKDKKRPAVTHTQEQKG